MAKFPRFKMEAAVFPSLSLSKCWLTEAPHQPPWLSTHPDVTRGSWTSLRDFQGWVGTSHTAPGRGDLVAFTL